MNGRKGRRPGGVIGPCTLGGRLRRGTVGLVMLCAAAGAGAFGWGLASGDAGGALVSAAPSAATAPVGAGGRVEVIWSHTGSVSAAEARTPARSSGRAAGDASSQAYRDPESGRWTAPPAGEVEQVGPQRASAATSTSAEGLLEEQVEGPRGGVRVSLRGRFRSALVAERDDEGQVGVGCGVLQGEDAASAAGNRRSPVPSGGEGAAGGER